MVAGDHTHVGFLFFYVAVHGVRTFVVATGTPRRWPNLSHFLSCFQFVKPHQGFFPENFGSGNVWLILFGRPGMRIFPRHEAAGNGALCEL